MRHDFLVPGQDALGILAQPRSLGLRPPLVFLLFLFFFSFFNGLQSWIETRSEHIQKVCQGSGIAMADAYHRFEEHTESGVGACVRACAWERGTRAKREHPTLSFTSVRRSRHCSPHD